MPGGAVFLGVNTAAAALSVAGERGEGKVEEDATLSTHLRGTKGYDGEPQPTDEIGAAIAECMDGRGRL